MEILPSPVPLTASNVLNPFILNSEYAYNSSLGVYQGYLNTTETERFLLRPGSSLVMPGTGGIAGVPFVTQSITTYSSTGEKRTPNPADYLPAPPPPPPPSADAIALMNALQQQQQQQFFWFAYLNSSRKKKGLGGGAIAAIVISSVVGLILISALLVYLLNNAGGETAYSERHYNGHASGVAAKNYYYNEDYTKQFYNYGDDGLFGQTPMSAMPTMGDTQMQVMSPTQKWKAGVHALSAANAMGSAYGGGAGVSRIDTMMAAAASAAVEPPPSALPPTSANRWQMAASQVSPAMNTGGGGTTLERFRHALEATTPAAHGSAREPQVGSPQSTSASAMVSAGAGATSIGRPMLIPEPWIATSDSYGRTVYYNNETGETKATPPAAAIAASTLAGLL